MLLGALMLLVTIAPPRWYVTRLAGPWDEGKQGVLILLAAEGVNQDMLGESSYWRCVYAVWAWRDGHFHHLLISGNRSVTQPMRDFVIFQGIPASAVVMEDQSLSTHENALFSAPILSKLPGPYVLLTSDYHMWRAHRSFTKAGLTVQPRPIPDAGKRFTSWKQRWTVCLELTEETAKIIYYWSRGWV